MNFVRNFVLIVGGALVSAVLGGAFAAVVSLISPDFVRSLFSPPEKTSVIRYGIAVGMIWGLFLGTAVMGFSLFLVTVANVCRLWKGNTREGEDA